MTKIRFFILTGETSKDDDVVMEVRCFCMLPAFDSCIKTKIYPRVQFIMLMKKKQYAELQTILISGCLI